MGKRNKTEVIKEAWIVEIGEEKYNEVKDVIDPEGWLHEDTLNEIDLSLQHKIDCYEDEWLGWFYRPLSIEGIEDNLGWNRIDEVGLPRECGDVIVYDDGEQIDCFYWYNDECFTRTADPSIFVIPTHWRKKEQLPNPIY